MSETIIEIKNINVSYGSNHVLKDVSLNIENKDFYTFLGPSGCGKTTLLRLIAGFEKSSSGELFIDGKEVSNLNPWERDVGMVFQNYALWPHMTVYKNISFGLEEKKLDKKEIKSRVDEVLELVDLKDLSGRYPFQLSGGQQQRVAIARAIINNPAILLADEPTGALDSKTTEDVLDLFDKLHESGITIVLVTHEDEVANRAKKIARFKDGRIVELKVN